MKKVISILISTILSLGFNLYNSELLDSAVYCISSADHISTSNQARMILEKFYTSAEIQNIEIKEEEIFVPIILVTTTQDFDIIISATDSAEEMFIEYKMPLNYNYKNYQIGSLKLGKFRAEQKEESEKQLSELFKTYRYENVQFYYGSEYQQYNSSLLVNIICHPDNTSISFVSVYVQNETEMTDDLLEALCEDFAYISLKDLRDLIG